MPRRRKAWAAWNYITRTGPSSPTSASSFPLTAVSDLSSPIDSVSLTYNMNILQHIPTSTYGDVLVTLNPLQPPSPSTVQGTWHYRHPLYTAAAVRAQKALPHPEPARHQLRGRVDKVRLPRGRLQQRRRGRAAAPGRRGRVGVCRQHVQQGQAANAGRAGLRAQGGDWRRALVGVGFGAVVGRGDDAGQRGGRGAQGRADARAWGPREDAEALMNWI